jgi:HEAT repeat protein
MLSSLALLWLAFFIAVVGWVALVAYVVQIDRRRTEARTLLKTLFATLDRADVRALRIDDRVARVREHLDRSSRELLMYAAADPLAPSPTVDVLSNYMGLRWAGALERDASAHGTPRERWRRITALRILNRLAPASTLPLLAHAVEQPDEAIAEASFALLSQSGDPRAIDVLFNALRAQRHPASRVASHLEASPQNLAFRLKGLLADPDANIRMWSGALLARYPDEPCEKELVALTDDVDPRVRKAALKTLGVLGSDLAADAAEKKLEDPVPYVRAHAARCLGDLGRADCAAPVAKLLGDHDWWTRLAARESLEMMGSDVWPIVMRSLSSDDEFVRNGAAEVIQNLGVLDSLIVMEAASDNPGEAKIAMLRNIAHAGGMRFTESLVERAGPVVGARIRTLLATIGLEHVEAL